LASFQKTPTEADSYADRVINYIPGEIVAAYIFIHSLVMNSGDFVQNNVLQKDGYFFIIYNFFNFYNFYIFLCKGNSKLSIEGFAIVDRNWGLYCMGILSWVAI
jgi:hypothetical protein